MSSIRMSSVLVYLECLVTKTRAVIKESRVFNKVACDDFDVIYQIQERVFHHISKHGKES